MLSLDKSLTQKDIEDLLNFFASDNNGNVDIDGSSFILFFFFEKILLFVKKVIVH